MHEEITIVLISHKSRDKIIKFIANLPKLFKIIVIDNSEDKKLKEQVLKNHKNTKIKLTKNNGYGSAINYARKFVDTKFLFVFNPDIINIDEKLIKIFYDNAVLLENNFLCMGPRFLKVKAKTHVQSSPDKKIAKIKAINGACMFINLEKFDQIKGFDENFFLFFEENDLCKRGLKKKFNIYQLNEAKIIHESGTSVIFSNEDDKNKFIELRNWHFIWSKFYFIKKHYSFLFAILYFFPILIRMIYRVLLYRVSNNKKKERKFLIRLEALIASIKNKKSYKRI